ncbi:MAG: SDR family oxidoreductase, partial [Candidatus Omnitrophica bacterium]|nr:SDR family oxidoreductase [Candidatus Omnitrophota bacterium]
MKDVIFVTGGTGFVGGYILRELVRKKFEYVDTIIVLVRGKSERSVKEKFFTSLNKIIEYKERNVFREKIKIVNGDITKKFFGLTKERYESLAKKITRIYHCAALCEFNIKWNEIKSINVYGTIRVLQFAKLCLRNKIFNKVHYVSTVAVAGNKKGMFYEEELDVGQTFNNTYEKSKFEAEKIIERFRDAGLPIIIYRPAIVIGDSLTGYTNNLKMIYQPLHFFSLNLFEKIPGDKKSYFSLCPVDYVAKYIIDISFLNNLKTHRYHIINPNLITFDDLVEISSKCLHFRKPEIIKPELFDNSELTTIQQKLLEPFLPYFSYT